MKFKEIEMHEYVQKAIEEMGFDKMTPIQSKTLPIILSGKDVIGQAQTGTGKTAAFGIPIIESSSVSGNKNKNVEHIIIAPTRELAEQIAKQLKLIAKYTDIQVCTLIGGVDFTKQKKDLKSNPSIVVGTPGRIQDHIRRKNLNLTKLKTFILDEADEMLKQGFKEDIEFVITQLPKTYQSLLFSATMNKEVEMVANKIMDNPVTIKVSTNKLEVKANIQQQGIIVGEKQKLNLLMDLIAINPNSRTIIFGRTKRRVDELSSALLSLGLNAKGLHGDLGQNDRKRILDGYRDGKFDFLVATDVAARGLDVNDVEFVYNFDLPQEIEYYVHRIGRTGRANKNGISISFIREEELSHIKKIEDQTKSKMEIIQRPSREEILELKNEILIKKLVKVSDNPVKNEVLHKLINKDFSKEELVIILTTLMSSQGINKDIKLTGEPSVRTKGGGNSRSRRSGGGYGRQRSRNGQNNNNRNNRSNSRGGSRGRSRNN